MSISAISPQRLANIQAAALDTQARLRHWLRSGLFRIAGNVMESTDSLRRRLIDNQAPGLAAMLASLPPIDQDGSPIWKYQFVSSISRIYMLSSAIINIESLSPEWQREALTLAGVAIPQEQALASAPVVDLWMCLSVIRQSFNSISMVKTWLVGQHSRRFAFTIDYQAGAGHIASSLEPGRCYGARLHFYPGIHSMRVAAQGVSRDARSFAPSAVAGLGAALRICRRAFADNPFMIDIPLIVSGLRIAGGRGDFCLADTCNMSFPIAASSAHRLRLMSCTGGGEFAAFVIFHQFCCQIAAFWAGGLFYVLSDDQD